MQDRYDIFGGLPDTIEDEWIENVEMLEEMMDRYVHLRKQARDVFELRYQKTMLFVSSDRTFTRLPLDRHHA